MSNSASVATWLPPSLVRRTAAPPAQGGRHLAPESPGPVRIASSEDVTRTGRHLEAMWSRELHDPSRDEIDAFEWLGFR
jgi:hypothetical protein